MMTHTITVVAALVVALGAPAFAQPPLPRLKISDNKRFLVTADGKPFFWLADTAWEIFHRLNPRPNPNRRRPQRGSNGCHKSGRC